MLKKPESTGTTMYFTIKKSGPFEIVLDSIEGSVYVIAVVEGGIVHKHGGIRAGDKIVSLNQYQFTGLPLEHVVLTMEKLMDDEKVELLDFSIVRDSGLFETHICPEFSKIAEEDEEIEEM